MSANLELSEGRAQLAAFYRRTLLDDVIPFWLRHGMDRKDGGIMTALDRDGSLFDSDKSVWFQGRAAWMFATLYNSTDPGSSRREEAHSETGKNESLLTSAATASNAERVEWLAAARSCVEFSRQHCYAPDGKMYFSVTREGKPLRMRRYVFSEAFAAIANAAFAKATVDSRAADDAVKNFATYLRYSFEPGVMEPKFESTRPMKGVAALMIGISTAQELRANLGDLSVDGRTCTEWTDFCIAEIERDFLKPEHRALMENVAPDGSLIDHLDGRALNPGHAIECAWFIMHEGALRKAPRLIKLGTTILDWMWKRGWDQEFGGLLYFTDVFGKPVQEYWHDMKFWWPHCEAIIATLLAWKLTGEARYAEMHRLVHEWSFKHFPDPEHGEWFGYLHRDGRVSQSAKGNLFKGPFHLPRMLWHCARLLRT